MFKHFTLLVAGLLTATGAFAQKVPSKPFVGDSMITPPLSKNGQGRSLDYRLVSKRAFATVVADRFTYLVTGDREFSTLGNFASINVLKPTATVAFGGILRNKNDSSSTRVRILSGSFTGAGDKDLVSLFSNDKLNSAFEARINYSTLSPLGNLFNKLPKVTKLFYEPTERQRLATQQLAATAAIEYERAQYLTQKNALANLFKKLLDKPQPIKPATCPDSACVASYYRKAQAYAKAWADYRAARFKLLRDSARFDSTLFQKAYADTVYAVHKTAKWSSVRLGWLDVFASVKQQNVQLFDQTATLFSSKLSENRGWYGRAGLALNVSYSSDKYKKIFNGLLRFEISYAKSNNLNQLTPFEVTTTQKFDSANVTRTATQKVNAYAKKEFQTSDYLDYRVDLLKQLTNNHRAYLRIVYNYSVPRNKGRAEADVLPATHDFTFAFLLDFNKKAEEKALVNFQPYIKLRDFTNEYQKDLTVLRRSEIGLLTTFPFGLPKPKVKPADR